MAAAYLFGLVKNHGYIGWNKRFLLPNGVRLTASELDAHETVSRVVEGRLPEEVLASWFHENTEGME